MYEAHHAMVFRTANRITGNAPDAEDVLQDGIFCVCCGAMGRLEIDNPESYLRRAAVNAALDVVRARQADHTLELERTASSGSCTDLRDLRDTLRRAMTGSCRRGRRRCSRCGSSKDIQIRRLRS